jgi:hypothetical protein
VLSVSTSEGDDVSTSWILAIDFGTTSTAAARRVGDRVELIQIHGSPQMPSMAFWRESSTAPDGGRLVLGQEADEQSSLAPWCLERSPKRRLGDDFMQLGEKQFRPVEIVAAILRAAMDEALALSGGEPPSEVRLTHPARWGKARLEKLRQAASLAGIESPIFIPEPVAAAAHFASERLSVGQHVAVYDLGGGTFDTAVLERTPDSFKVIGRPGGDEELGGEDFDDELHRHLGEKLDAATWQSLRTSSQARDRAWAQANRELMRQAHRAKEGLSRNPDYAFYAAPPIDSELTVTADEFERLIAPELRGTVSELESTIRAAGLKPEDMAAIYLAGGSSKIPLVGRLVEERFGVRPQHLDDPKAVIALGAARMDTPAVQNEPDPTPVVPDGMTPPPPPGGAETPPPPPPPSPGPDSGDRTEVEPVAPLGAVTPPLPPPVSPGGTSKQTGSRTPKLVALGVLAALVIGGGVAAVLASGGGDDGGETSASVSSGEGDTGDPPAEVPTTPEEAESLQRSILNKYRASCTNEPQNNWAKDATAGIECTGPGATAIYVEQFDSLFSAKAAFKDFSGDLPYDPGVCGGSGWNARAYWTDGEDPQRGFLSCQDIKDVSWVQWTDNERTSVAWISEPDGDDYLAFRAFKRVAN